MAAGVLERKGFKKVSSLDGGSQAWIDSGYPVYGSDTKQAQVSSVNYPKREINLPGIISPSELKGLLMDLPGSFDLVDIRPPDHFADYNLPGSKNVDIVDLIDNPAHLVGTGPLIIVDRDGALAMIAAGMIYNKSKREIKALRGGLEEYWKESNLPEMLRTGESMKIDKMPGMPPPKPKPQPEQKTDDKPVTPKKKSAGC